MLIQAILNSLRMFLPWVKFAQNTINIISKAFILIKARLLLLVGISAAFDSGGTSSWDVWNEWSECDRTCGHGLKVRTRDCLGGHPGSAGCQGASYEKRQCSSSICRECIRSQWAFQLKNSTELISTEIIRTQQRVDQTHGFRIQHQIFVKNWVDWKFSKFSRKIRFWSKIFKISSKI